MKIISSTLLVGAVFFTGCDINKTTVTVDDTPNQIVEVNFAPVKEEGKDGRVQMEIIMELNTIFPAYPTGGFGITAEKLKLVADEYEVSEGTYRGTFTFVPNDEVKELSLEDFSWTPYIEFDPITLPTSQEQIKAE